MIDDFIMPLLILGVVSTSMLIGYFVGFIEGYCTKKGSFKYD